MTPEIPDAAVRAFYFGGSDNGDPIPPEAEDYIRNGLTAALPLAAMRTTAALVAVARVATRFAARKITRGDLRKLREALASPVVQALLRKEVVPNLRRQSENNATPPGNTIERAGGRAMSGVNDGPAAHFDNAYQRGVEYGEKKMRQRIEAVMKDWDAKAKLYGWPAWIECRAAIKRAMEEK